MQELHIGENDAGQRFDKYLKKLLAEAPGSFVYKMLRKKNITLNLSLIHISEPTRQAEISYAVFCLKKKKQTNRKKE